MLFLQIRYIGRVAVIAFVFSHVFNCLFYLFVSLLVCKIARFGRHSFFACCFLFYVLSLFASSSRPSSRYCGLVCDLMANQLVLAAHGDKSMPTCFSVIGN